MGLDYFRSATGKACAKRWNGAHNYMKEPDLFGIQVIEKNRTVTASLTSKIVIELGAALIVKAVEESLVVCDQYSQIGRIDAPSEFLLKAVKDRCGLSIATVERLSMLGNSMELRLE